MVLGTVTGVNWNASDKPITRIMTSKISLDSYIDAGVLVSIELVNELALVHAYGKPASEA